MNWSKIVKGLGLTYLVLAVGFIVVSAGAIWAEHGFRRMLQLWSPFETTNFTIILLTLAPGLALLAWAENLDKPKR